MTKKAVDKDLKRFVQLERATLSVGRRNINLGLGLLFLVAVWVFASFHHTGTEGSIILIVAAVIGGYMALNIGANDVANNVGPAVGSKAITLVGALIIAAIFEAAGAIIAGGDVVTTISKNIIDTEAVASKSVFIWAMMAALLSAALWVNLATWIGAPVSTTHSIVGGVMGAGIASAGFSAVNWFVMGKIAASWVISPIMGGAIAAAFLAFVTYFVLYKEDKIAASKTWVPVLVSIMAGAFSVYLVMKGLKRIWKVDIELALVIGLVAFVISYLIVKPAVAKASAKLENRGKSVSELFTIPLICAAALLSFAHGANDVANAVGPLAAIVGAITEGTVAAKVTLPIWVLTIGALGIAVGLVLYGPKIIEIVGEKITKLNRVRAFCVALSAAITVIIASTLGLPVSSTHIAVGGVFGVGFFREFIANKERKKFRQMLNKDEQVLEDDSKSLSSSNKITKRKLVRRSHLMTILAAWVITVPSAAILSGLIFFGLIYLF